MEVKRIKVLVADRDSNVVRECKTNLEPYGFEVIEGKRMRISFRDKSVWSCRTLFCSA